MFKKCLDGVMISNKIFKEVLYNYMLSKIRTKLQDISSYNS